MRICFIVGTFPSLSETFILNQMTWLLDRGHALNIFAGARSGDAIVHEDVIRSGLMKHVRFHNEKPGPLLARVGKFLTLFPSALARSPGTVLRSLNGFRFGREAWSLGLFFKTLAFGEARDCDIVFCHSGTNGLVGLGMKEVGALKGKLVVVFNASDLMACIGSRDYKKLFERGDLFLSISRHSERKMVSSGCPEKKIQVHRMGLDLSQFRITTHKRFGTVPLRLISVARLEEHKGLRYGIEAVDRLGRDGLDCDYTIVGDGPLRQELEGLARDLKVSAKVHFTGWQDSGAVRHYLKEADIFLAPGIRAGNGNEEGIPVVLMEAMASRVPVVSTMTDGIREIIEDGKTGFLVEDKSAASIANKLRSIWADPLAAEQVAVGARRIIEEQYNIDSLNQVLVKLFSAVAYEKRRS